MFLKTEREKAKKNWIFHFENYFINTALQYAPHSLSQFLN